ncbi:MAG: outer membrane lipoprotein carrier protein LolA [Deinococcales bacterium]
MENILLKKLSMLSLLLLSFLSLASLGKAQALTIDELMAKLEQTAGEVIDFQTLLSGEIIDPSGQSLELEIFSQFIRETNVGRAEFIRPDALADNFIVLDQDTVYNYLFLTNQVTVYDASDPDAFGGLFPEASESEQELFIGLDPNRLFLGWEGTMIGYESEEIGNLYHVRFDNTEDDTSDVGYILAWIVDGLWYPYRLEIYLPDDTLVARLQFNDFERDLGLSASDLTYVPEDAEVIDER